MIKVLSLNGSFSIHHIYMIWLSNKAKNIYRFQESVTKFVLKNVTQLNIFKGQKIIINISSVISFSSNLRLFFHKGHFTKSPMFLFISFIVHLIFFMS